MVVSQKYMSTHTHKELPAPSENYLPTWFTPYLIDEETKVQRDHVTSKAYWIATHIVTKDSNWVIKQCTCILNVSSPILAEEWCIVKDILLFMLGELDVFLGKYFKEITFATYIECASTNYNDFKTSHSF